MLFLISRDEGVLNFFDLSRRSQHILEGSCKEILHLEEHISNVFCVVKFNFYVSLDQEIYCNYENILYS